MVEAILAPRRALALNAASRTLVTLPVDLDPQAASITVRIPRPTSANPLAWGATGRIKVRLCVEHDGVLHTCEGGTRGGVMRDNRPGRGGAEIPEYSLTWNLPTGFFAQGNEPKEMWPAIANRRWGETAKASYRAWVEVERLAGSIAAKVEVRAAIEPAPPLEYHSSVAYQNSSSVVEDIGGDMATSLSYDAGAGSDRAALIWASACRDSAPTSISLTFNSSTPSTSAWEVAETNTRQKAMVVLDSEIGSGAKTVACAGSGGSGSIYGTHLHIASFTGVHQTTPLGTAQTTSGATGTSISVTVASPATDSVVVDGLWAATQGGTAPTIGASQTQRQGTSANGSVEAGRTSTQGGADGGVMSWTKGSSNWNYVYGAIELKAASGSTTVTSDVTTTAAVSTTNTSNVTSTASIGITVTSDVSTTAATSRVELLNVTSDASIGITVTADVTTSAAVSTTNTADVTTDAAVQGNPSLDVTTTAAVSATVTTDVTTSGAVSTTNTTSVTTDAALARTETSNVTTDAAVQVTVTLSVTSDASISVGATGTLDVTTTASVQTTVTGDVGSGGSISIGVTTSVTTDASVGIDVTSSVTSTAALSRTETGQVTSTAALEAQVTLSVTTSASVSVEGVIPLGFRLQPGVGRLR